MRYSEITESTGITFTGEFPIAAEIITASKDVSAIRYEKRFKETLPEIQDAIQNKEVINTAFATIKTTLNRYVEAVFKVLMDVKFYQTGAIKDEPEDVHYIGYPSEVRLLGSFHKKLVALEKKQPNSNLVKELKKVTNELLILQSVYEFLKNHTVKASAKKQATKQEKEAQHEVYQKKYMDHRDVAKVVKVLKDKAAEVERGIYEEQLKFFHNIVSDYQKHVAEGRTDYLEIFKNSPMHQYVIQGLVERVFNRVHRHTDPRVFKLKGNWEQLIEAEAKQVASDIVDGFVYKNSGKLSYVIYSKDNMKDVELRNVHLGRGAVECDLYVTFEDGSSFVASSSVVLAHSIKGKPFYRYPTIFRNVTMPDGSKLKQPSEKRMDEIFAKA